MKKKDTKNLVPASFMGRKFLVDVSSRKPVGSRDDDIGKSSDELKKIQDERKLDD